jgi:hypothetical protein
MLRKLRGMLRSCACPPCACGGAEQIVVMDESGGPLVRVWCLLEVWTTLKLKGPEALHIMTPGFSLRQLSAAFEQVQCGRPALCRWSHLQCAVCVIAAHW